MQQQPKQIAKPQSEQHIRVAGSKDKPAIPKTDTIRIERIVHDTVRIVRVDTLTMWGVPMVQHDTVRDSTRCAIIPIPIPIPIRSHSEAAEAAAIPSTVTPEPATIILVAIGLCIIALRAWWTRKRGPQ